MWSDSVFLSGGLCGIDRTLVLVLLDYLFWVFGPFQWMGLVGVNCLVGHGLCLLGCMFVMYISYTISSGVFTSSSSSS